MVILRSDSYGGAHATLVVKLKGKILHINNQNWPLTPSSLQQWAKTWAPVSGLPDWAKFVRRLFDSDDVRFEIYAALGKPILK